MKTEDFFGILSHPLRLRLLKLLTENTELCVCDLHEATASQQPVVSRHLGIMREAGVVNVRRAGQWVFYRLNPELPLWAVRVLDSVVTAMRECSPYLEDAARLARNTKANVCDSPTTRPAGNEVGKPMETTQA